jgi:hypothetical protein
MFSEFVSSFGHGSLLSYIDGGTGSMLIQAAIAGLLSTLYLARTKFGQLKALISSRAHKNSRQ